MQHLLREEIRKQKKYWIAKRVVGLVSTAIACAAVSGFNLKYIFNLQAKIAHIDRKIGQTEALKGEAEVARAAT